MDQRQRKAIGMPQNPPARACRSPPNDDQETESQNDLDDGGRLQTVATGRFLAVAVGRETIDPDIVTGLARSDEVEKSGRRNRAEHLNDNVGQEILGVEAATDIETDADGGVEMTAGYVADGISHGEDREAKGERHANEPDAHLRKAAANTALPQPPKTSQKVPMNSAVRRFVSATSFPLDLNRCHACGRQE